MSAKTFKQNFYDAAKAAAIDDNNLSKEWIDALNSNDYEKVNDLVQFIICLPNDVKEQINEYAFIDIFSFVVNNPSYLECLEKLLEEHIKFNLRTVDKNGNNLFHYLISSISK